MRWVLVVCCMAAVTLSGAQAAQATTFIVNVSDKPNVQVSDGYGEISGAVSFPDIDMHVGDQIMIAIDFGETIQFNSGLRIISSFGESYFGPDVDNGEIRISSPSPIFIWRDQGETLSVTGESNFVFVHYAFGKPSPQDGFSVASFNYEISSVPEPATWAILTASLFGLGSALRNPSFTPDSRRSAAASR